MFLERNCENKTQETDVESTRPVGGFIAYIRGQGGSTMNGRKEKNADVTE